MQLWVNTLRPYTRVKRISTTPNQVFPTTGSNASCRPVPNGEIMQALPIPTYYRENRVTCGQVTCLSVRREGSKRRSRKLKAAYIRLCSICLFLTEHFHCDPIEQSFTQRLIAAPQQGETEITLWNVDREWAKDKRTLVIITQWLKVFHLFISTLLGNTIETLTDSIPRLVAIKWTLLILLREDHFLWKRIKTSKKSTNLQVMGGYQKKRTLCQLVEESRSLFHRLWI